MELKQFDFANSSLLKKKLKKYFPNMGDSEDEVEQAMIKILKNHPKEFGLNLRKIRTSVGLLQKTLCDALGVSQNTWSCWEKGIHSPRLANLDQISSYLKIDIGELFIELKKSSDEVGYLPIYDGTSFLNKSYEDVATKRVLLSPKEFILDIYRGEFDFAFRNTENVLVDNKIAIPLNALVMCSSSGLTAEKEKDLFFCSGKIVVMSITRQQAMLRRIKFDGKILKIEPLSKDEDSYEFPVSEEVFNTMPDKSKAMYHNYLTLVSSVDIFAIAKKCVSDM
ncbi:MAG TPA: helix-turn-helix domain-containing protein [Succinivibrionaceae bacterium]|nr:helix-turn-helix domain-containing protein [Succinivibrionaceae bacterium]